VLKPVDRGGLVSWDRVAVTSKPWKDGLVVTALMLGMFAVLGLAVLLCVFSVAFE
jgi:hypothetical protein